MIRLSWVLCLLLCVESAWAQTNSDSLLPKEKWSPMISAPYFGLIVPHKKEMTHLIQGHSYGLHVNLNKQLITKAWHSAYNFPEQGIDLTYIYTGNPEQLGQQVALSYLLNLPLNRKNIDLKRENSKHRIRHWIGIGIGIGYSSQIWDLKENHQAPVIGSHLNAALIIQYSTRLLQLKKSQIRAGLRITHFSNGAFQIPNLGTNNAGIFLSYKILDSPNKYNHRSTFETDYKKTFRTSIFFGAGLKEIQPPTQTKYAAFTLSLLEERRITYKSSLGIGIDMLYNSSLKTIQERRGNPNFSANQVWQSGVVLSYTLHLNNFELKMQQGIYIRDKHKLDGLLYHRFGLRYHINNHWFAQLTLKTHFAKADFGEWGFGYAF